MVLVLVGVWLACVGVATVLVVHAMQSGNAASTAVKLPGHLHRSPPVTIVSLTFDDA